MSNVKEKAIVTLTGQDLRVIYRSLSARRDWARTYMHHSLDEESKDNFEYFQQQATEAARVMNKIEKLYPGLSIGFKENG